MIGSWVGAAAGTDPGFILISRNAAQVEPDISKGLGQPHRSLVLQGGQTETADGPVNLFHALDDEELWNGGRRIVLGASVTEGLHPVLVDALAGLIVGQTRSSEGLRMQRGGELVGAGPISPAASGLGAWIADRARDSALLDAGDVLIEIEELEYFVASSGWRAFALTKTLDAARVERSFPEVVDIGGGIGLMPWLLVNETRRGVRRATIVEPSARFQRAAIELWSHGDLRIGDDAARIVPTTADQYRIDRDADLVLMCQSLYNIPEHARSELLRRCWEAVKPGGLLAINEIVLDDDASDAEAVRRAHRHSPRRGETIGLLSRFGAPQLFRAHTNWSRPEDPLTMAARDYGSDNFLVVRKAPARP